MGCPGAGKSTVGVLVAEILGMKIVDFDLDVLENVWGMKVADKVTIVQDGTSIIIIINEYHPYSQNHCFMHDHWQMTIITLNSIYI